jgi:hypothetical protein
MADHENSTASLGRAEASPVHHPEGPPIPEVFQSTEDGGCVPSLVTSEKPFGVLDDDPPGSGLVNEPEVLFEQTVELPEESGSSASEPRTMWSGDGRVLAGEPADSEVGVSQVGSADITDVSLQWDVGEATGEQSVAVRVDLAHRRVDPCRPCEAQLEPTDAGERRGEGERHEPSSRSFAVLKMPAA